MLQARTFFGIKTRIKDNLWNLSDEEILYVVGGVIVVHNFVNRSQRYINLFDPAKFISLVTISKDKNYVAVAEKANENELPRIYVYDIKTSKKLAVLGIPFEINADEFMRVLFTHDSHHIAALTAGSDYIMYYYNWKNGKIESQVRANNPPSTPGPLTDMAINPKDATIIVFVGIGLFRLVSMSENVWRQYGFQKAQSFSILSVCWLSGDLVLAGCEDGKILIVQSGDLNGVYEANSITELQINEMIETKKDQMKLLQRISTQTSIKKTIDSEEPTYVECCTSSHGGFFYSQKPGEVEYFERANKKSYKRKMKFVIKRDIFCSDANYNSLYTITRITTNDANSVIYCLTNRSQIYWAHFKGCENNQIYFDIFEQSLHHGPISGLDTCLWKPLFITCGQYDNSVRIWNHLTMKLILNQTFVDKVTDVSLHPTGLYAVIAFLNSVQFCLVLVDELRVRREFGISRCQLVSFSNNGHLFAAESNYDILLYSSVTFDKVACFKGHCQKITSLRWSRDDYILYSCSVNGAIYEWNVTQTIRNSDVVLQDAAVKSLVVLKNGKVICIDSDARIKEIQNSKVVVNEKLDHENANCLDFVTVIENNENDKCYLLLAGKNGVVITLRYPIDEESCEMQFFSTHNCPIVKCCVVNDGRSFVSVDIEGNICIWDVVRSFVQHRNDETAELSYFREILINVDELVEKQLNFNHMTRRLIEIENEHEYKLKRQEETFADKIKELEENNANAIQILKKRIQTLDREHSMELNRIHLDVVQLKQTHTSQMDKMKSNFDAKLLYEFHKYDSLQKEIENLKLQQQSQIDEPQKQLS